MSNDIKNLLDIQDENIYFENSSTEIKEFKGKTSKFITGTLTYQPSCCENCGIKNENYTVYKNGTKTSRITYNNGRIEGVNNKIKDLNPVAYGYKNFYNFKNRITLHFKLRPVLKQKETHSKAA